MKPKSKILIIAGSDSSGGAGIQADIKTVTALGGYAMTAVTAITSQNTTGVNSVTTISPIELKKQILFTSKDIKPDAIKIGMLHSSKTILTVLKSLKKIKTKKIILDPVMVAKGGFRLINDEAIKTLRDKLIQKVHLITPNIPEAEVLTKTKIKNINDIFLNKNELKIYKNKRIKTKNTHGTGCTLSSAIATFFACGKSLNKSCELGIKYVNHSIKSNLNYGKGHGPINHLNSIKIDRKFK